MTCRADSVLVDELGNYRLLLTMGATIRNLYGDSLNLYVARRPNSIFTTGITAPNN
jgi:hypothetical protein